MRELLMNRKASFMMYIIACFLPVITELSMKGVFAMVFVCMEKQDIQYFKFTAVLAVGAVLLALILYITSRMMRIGFMRDILLDIRKKAFQKILKLQYKDFGKVSKDVYLSHLTNDIDTFENNFFLNLLNIIYMSGLLIVSTIVVLVLDWKMGIVMSIIAIMMFFLGSRFGKKTEEMQLKVTDANEKMTVQATNTFNGLEILKLSGVEERFLDKNLNKINNVENKKRRLTLYTELQRGLMTSLTYIIIIGQLLYALIKIMNGSNLGIELFIFQLCQSMVFPLVEIIPRINVVKGSIRIYKKITEYDEQEEVASQKNKPFTFNKSIQVNDLNFAYDGKMILKNVKLNIEKGKKYLIKGASGSGKSTLLKILSRTIEADEGHILSDGISYDVINEKSFNDHVAFVYQDVFLFEDTIANNISLYKDMTEDVLMEAIKKAGLQDFIESLPEGIHTSLTENGKNLSGGQRQRISIARAIAKGAKILFVDEGTSALNEKMGAEIEKELLNLDCTIIAISHRYYEGVTNHYDNVIELKFGVANMYDGQMYFEEVATC
ncbi:MAG: ABC transporter ATP-binding protein [Cellulosilyticaceae bacterium]